MQVATGSGMTMNVNQMLIGPVFMNVSVIVLFVMPMITMRTYAEEKRSGTIELLLTSPLTDLQIILGKFFGALGPLRGDAGRHPDPHRGAVLLRQSRVEAGRHRLSRAAADGRVLHLGRAVHLEPDQEPDRGRHGHLRGVPDAVGDQLDRPVARARPARRSSPTCRSPITSTTSRAASSTPSTWSTTLSFIVFGLFLTAKSVDSERWRG